MRSVSDVSRDVVRQQRSGSVTQQPQRTPVAISQETVTYVNQIFEILKAAFPASRHMFENTEDLNVTKRQWVKALMQAGINSDTQIARGTKAARLSESPFLPSAGEFISWCKPSAEELGMPCADTAWREANEHSHHCVSHRWSHPGVYEAGRRTGWFEIRNGSAKRKSFDEYYQVVLEAVSNGQVFKQPVPDANSLEHHRNGRQVQTEQSKARGRSAIAQMRANLGMGA